MLYIGGEAVREGKGSIFGRGKRRRGEEDFRAFLSSKFATTPLLTSATNTC